MSYRYFIEIIYKGTDFHGWQIQPDVKSIQETIQNALSTLLGKETEIYGAGRTDAGVHATQIFAHFDSKKPIDKNDMTYRLNAIVSKNIVIKKIHKVNNNAHARFDAVSRSYEYHIHLIHDPFLLDTSWQLINKRFDIYKMNDAAKILLKHTNFKAFSKTKTDVKTYKCDISNAEWIINNDHLVFYITADRFLRNMVRAIVGTLLEVGENKLSIDNFEKVILSQNRRVAGVSVPAKGLFLTSVTYPEKIFR